MTFLSPLLLWGLLASSIPVIIHLFSLRHTKEIEFSSLKFIRELEHETIRRLKIRQWLLVLLRMLIIICIVLMVSRPVIKGFIPSWIAGKKESRVVILLDNSASMTMEIEGRSLLENGKSTIMDIADLYDETTIFRCYQSNPLKLIFDGNPREHSLRSSLELIQNTNATDHLFIKLDSILQIQEAHEPNKECFIISDFSKQIYSDMRDYRAESSFLTDTSETGWRFYCLEQKKILNNLSLKNVNILSQIRLPNSLLKIEAEVSNDGSNIKKNIPVELFLEQDRLGQVVASFNKNQQKEFLYQVYPGISGVVQGYLEIPEDDYSLDDHLSFDFTVPDQISCLIVGRSSEEIFLLETSLSSIENQTGFLQIETQINQNPTHLSLDNIDVLILYNLGKFVPVVIDEIQQFLNKGGGIILFAGDRMINYADKITQKTLRLPIVTGLSSSSEESFYSIAEAREDHPILSDLKLRHLDKELPQVYSYVKIKMSDKYNSIFTLNNGDPFLIEFPLFGGNLFYFTSLMDLTWSDLPVKGLAVSLLHRILLYSATDENNTNPIVIGDKKDILVEDKNLNAEWTLITPTGKKVQLIPDYNLKKLNIHHTEELGSYKVLNDGLPYASFSTRLSEFEYPSERLTEVEVKNLFLHDRLRWITPQTDLKNHLRNVRYGSSLWRGFLILAIILFLIETLLGMSYAKHES